jgi:serine/threonine protein kinase
MRRIDWPAMPANNAISAAKSGFLIGYNEIRFERKVGAGGFGEIWKGEWAGTPVAIKKILNVNMSDSDISALSHEISLTRYVA